MIEQTVTLGGKRFVIVEQKRYTKLKAMARIAEEGQGPALPRPDAEGNYPAREYVRASLARRIIRRRRAAGLTQADLARRAGVRAETLNRLERGKATPEAVTVEKIVQALEAAEAAEPD